jgi:hypothetical protein
MFEARTNRSMKTHFRAAVPFVELENPFANRDSFGRSMAQFVGKIGAELSRRLPMSSRQARNAWLKSFVAVIFVSLFGTFSMSQTPPVQMTAEQDRQNMLDQLHITSLRDGVNNHDPKAPNQPNYDEEKANPYPELPDPLVLNNGKRVTSAAVWWRERRPQIVELFDKYVFGRVPDNVPQVRWEVVSTKDEAVGATPVITKELVGHVDNSSYALISVDIRCTLTVPAHTRGPVPIMLQFAYDPVLMARLRANRPAAAQPPASQQPVFSGPSWQEQLIANGWGYVTYIPTSVQADNGAGLTQGIIGLVNKGQPRKPEDWGALRAWAWGASRVLDYLETDKSVDAKRVGVEGHSRYGKGAIVAMAYDRRFAIGYISSSGEGGVKLFRRNWGEPVENVAAVNEYHWMAGNFLKYAGPLTPKDMPVDTNELVALCAPRPVFVSGGSPPGDAWVDAKGMFMAEVGAGPVYQLLGKKDLGTSVFPPVQTALLDGDLAFRQHQYGHTDAPNWSYFITFANRYFESPK